MSTVNEDIYFLSNCNRRQHEVDEGFDEDEDEDEDDDF
jgi:hypothetical protein